MKKQKQEEPWVRVPLKAIKDKELTYADMIVLALIIDITDGRTCKVSCEYIAETARMGRATVTRAIKKLERKGYIMRVQMPGETNYYKQMILTPKKRKTEQEKKETAVLEKKESPALLEKKQAKTLQEKAEEADFSEAVDLMRQGFSFAEAVEKITKENEQ